MNISNRIQPIILSGGSGTRLWPLSRESFPKQFITLENDSLKSLLQITLDRIKNLENLYQPIVICNEEHRFIAAEQLRELQIKPKTILLEPFGKNTAPAITAGAIKAIEEGEDPILLVLAADHEIKNTSKFINSINRGIKYALKNYLVTFGVIPTSPATGFGYIKAKQSLDYQNISGEEIDKFIEKPSKSIAEELILDKRYSWNSGIFMFKASTFLKELNNFLPDLIAKCQNSLKKNIIDLDFQRIDKKYFKDCPNISIDNGLMEKTNKGIVIPLDAGWSDIGSWKAVWENSKKDDRGNSKIGKVLIENSKNCYLRSENSLLVGIDIENLIIIETRDAVLIANKNQTEKVKDVVKKLKSKGMSEGNEHKKINRPWGNYVSIEENSTWKVKKIEVNPKSSLSLQMHKHRSEHWVVLSGIAKVQVDDKEIILHKNQSTYIPLKSKHRLTNPGIDPLIIIEVQSGSYLGEDDIIRFEDNYGR